MTNNDQTDSEIIYKSNLTRGPTIYMAPSGLGPPIVLGFKGQSELDTGYFYAPYWPGATKEQNEAMDYQREQTRSMPATDLQRFIMDIARGYKNVRDWWKS